MLLTSVALKNFMKHESLVVSLEAGMNVIRGSNEAGKSSLLTGIAYNWFGSGALPQSVDDTVTWEAKKSSMKTKTNFTVGDHHYICKRSASGAELYRGNSVSPIVTGHKEVSSAIATLFELPSVATATKLQIASQNDVRGVISLGATAAAAFIEELIDMREIDDMIKDVSERLTYSSDARKQAVASADSAEEQLKATAKPVSTKKLENEVAALQENVTSLAKGVEEARVASTNAEVALRTCAGQRSATAAQYEGLKSKIATLDTKLGDPTEGVTAEEIATEAGLLEQTNAYNFYIGEYLPFLKTKPEVTWEGTIASLELYIKGLEDKQDGLRDETVDLTMAIAKDKAGIVTDTVCPTCKQDICDVSKVEARNKELQASIDILEAEVAPLAAKAAECSGFLKEAKAILVFQQKQELWLAKRDHVAEALESVVPKHILLIGGVPTKPARTVTQGSFNTLCLERDKQRAAEEAYEVNLEIYTKLREEEEEFKSKLEDQAVGQSCAEETKKWADIALQEVSAKLSSAVAEHSESSSTLVAIRVTNESVSRLRETLTEDIKNWRKQAEEIQENYNLVAALRSARLDISSLLWQKLLGVTETYFSLFRGKQSTLDMSKKGILVDGKLSAPSGSTLDILGLALRLAMSKLFANNGLCILDEPSAGCDDNRTAAMTGGLISAGFDQVIMVTHKDVDEQAGNLILI